MTALTKVSASILGSTTVLSVVPLDTEAQKLIISGATAIVVQLVSQLFSYLKTRRRIKKLRKLNGATS